MHFLHNLLLFNFNSGHMNFGYYQKEQTIDGRDVLKVPGPAVKHRSEDLYGFILEHPTTDPPPLACAVDCAFKYDDGSECGLQVKKTIHVVYPHPKESPPIVPRKLVGQVRFESF